MGGVGFPAWQEYLKSNINSKDAFVRKVVDTYKMIFTACPKFQYINISKLTRSLFAAYLHQLVPPK